MSEQNEQKDQRNMAGCEKFEAALEDYASGELPRRDARRLTAHLESCHECREALEDARLAGRLATVFDGAAEPGPAFTQRVMAQIHVAERWVREQRSFWRPIEAWSWRLALSASLALALLFAYGLRTAQFTGTQQTPVTLTPQTDDAYTVPVSASSSSNDEVLMTIAERHHERQ